MDTIESIVYICKACNVMHFILSVLRLSISLLILLTNWSDMLIIMFKIFYLKFYLLWFFNNVLSCCYDFYRKDVIISHRKF